MRSSKRVAPLFALAFLVGLWELLCRILQVDEFVLPTPSAIASEMGAERVLLIKHTWITLQEVLLGFCLCVVVGIPLAVLIVYSSFFKNVLYPLFVSAQAVPRIAIAPLIVLWFGFGATPKVLVAFSVAVFPLVINTAIGLEATPRDTVFAVRSMGASELQIFRKARFPTALPYIFGGLKLAISLCVIGAVVGEFVGANGGLAYLINVAQGTLNTRLIFAAIAMMAIMGVALFYAIEMIERRVIHWHYASRRDDIVREEELAKE